MSKLCDAKRQESWDYATKGIDTMMFGYARVSTDDQRLDLQKDALEKAGVRPENLYEENISGVKKMRPQLHECLRSLREGDVLVIWRLDRLGRSLVELCRISQDLEKRGVELRSLTECIDTTTAGGKLVFNMFGAVAQFERDIISERTKAGLKAARRRGNVGGRKPKMTPEKLKMAEQFLATPGVTQKQAAACIEVSRETLSRAMKAKRDRSTARALADLKRAAE